MIKHVVFDQVRDMNLVPVAVIDASPAKFKTFGVEFTQECDDLGELEIAILEIEFKGVIALMRYKQSSENETTLMFPSQIDEPSKFTEMIANVAYEFDMPVSMFHWRFEGEMVSLSKEVHENVCETA